MNQNAPVPADREKCIQDIGKLLQKASQIFQTMEREQVIRDGYSTTQTRLLFLLQVYKELTVIEIAEHLRLEKSTASRIIKLMLRDNLLFSTTGSSDKRQLFITLTDFGKETAQNLINRRQLYYSRIISLLPSGHVREVMDATRLLVESLESTLPN